MNDDDLFKALVEFALTADPSPKLAHVTRLSMYQALSGMLSPHDGVDKACLCISNSQLLAKMLGLIRSKLVVANYPEHDLVSLAFADNTFDFCISDQVLEHVEGNPFKAVSESLRVVKKGGYVAHTTCLINEIHGAPGDFWRFTPDGLKLLVKEGGGEVVSADGWGNQAVNTYMRLGFRFRAIPNNPKNPIYQLATHNETKIPISTWIIAKKP
jgi:SAM-dependent methyltransferase